MATSRTYVCTQCKSRRPAGGMFDALQAVVRRRAPSCPECDRDTELHFRFAFGLGATHADCTILDAFLPSRPEAWRDGHNRITFYPFLVIVRRHGRKTAVWLPYWHLVEGKRRTIKKYGQWAPFMDAHLFRDLLRQARRRGYFR